MELRALLEAAGGLGLFLLGMVIMTDGLRKLAGDAIQRILRRYTASPTSGAMTGTLVTALLQSSSATTVSAVGFAGAGLLSFPQALGIVFGANVGTTVTGWMVVILGFKLDLAAGMPAVILVGALLRLFGRDRVAHVGFAIAGFGLIFLGIDALQTGMGGIAQSLGFERFPADTWLGRLRLLGFGVLLTLVTQSSSAGVATALAAVSTGAISFPQAAAMVIGMDVGTTVTAAVATVGASLPARRTGWAHVIYNLLTGIAAFSLLPAFVLGLESALPGATVRNPELSLVGFHTAFNLLGVVAVLPLASAFARLVERIVPDRPGPFTQRLERSLLSEPELALRAAAPTLEELARQAFGILSGLLRGGERAPGLDERIELLQIAVDDVEHYLDRLAPTRSGSSASARRTSALHVVDQLRRLLRRELDREDPRAVQRHAELRERAQRLAEALHAGDEREAALAALRDELTRRRPGFRSDAIAASESGRLAASEALDLAEGYRWLERVSHHGWRIVHHQARLAEDLPSTQERRQRD